MIDQLRARLAEAVEAGDKETAEALRDAIGRIERGESKLTEQVPGRMGLARARNATSAGATGRPRESPIR